MHILCASNLRLGRRISGVPDHLNLDPARLSTSAVWNQIVDVAASQDVDAVLLAGNVIDRENREFEPLGPLERGLATLEQHGIPVVAVAGQHDFDTLPAAAKRLGETIEVLDDSSWDQMTIDDVTVLGRSAADAAGWSNLPGAMPGDIDATTIGMLPASLTGDHTPEAVFQPVSVHALTDTDVRLWLLGGQREPDLIEQSGTIMIEPGATCPLAPIETGPFGAWIVDTETPADSQHLALSPIRFESVDIDVTGINTLGEIENRVVGSLHETLSRCIGDDPLGQLLCVPCVITLTGVTRHAPELPELMSELATTLDIQHDGVVVAITNVQIDARPDIELPPLLGRPDPVGELARLLTWLDGGEVERPEAHAALLQRTVTRLQGVHRARVFATVASDPEPDTDMARDVLRRESWNVLDALIRQRGVE